MRRYILLFCFVFLFPVFVLGRAGHPSKEGNDGFYSFDSSFLSLGNSSIKDVSRFDNYGWILPGSYYVDVIVNDIHRGKYKIIFKEGESEPFVDKNFFKFVGIKGKYKDDLAEIKDREVKINYVSEEISYEFNQDDQKITIQIPQGLINQRVDFEEQKKTWDEGITALKVGYDGNIYGQSSTNEDSYSAYMMINAAFNFAGWQAYYQGIYNSSKLNLIDVNHNFLYLRKNISDINSFAILGQYISDGRILDSVPYRGVGLADDEKMLPRERRGYAPNITGHAHSNAKITVSQNNIIVDQKIVPPGPYELDAIKSWSHGGDIHVTIEEEDGTYQTYTIPDYAGEMHIRPGNFHYNVVLGSLDDPGLRGNHDFLLGSYQRGISNFFSLHSGTLLNSNYQSYVLGAGVSTQIGSFDGNVTKFTTKVKKENHDKYHMDGGKISLKYNKSFKQTSNTLALLAEKHTGAGYMDFGTAAYYVEHTRNLMSQSMRFGVNFNQRLGDEFGQLNLSGYLNKYNGLNKNKNLQYQISYSRYVSDVSVTMSLNRYRRSESNDNVSYMLNFNIPLGGNSLSNMTTGITGQRGGNSNSFVSMNGTAGDGNNFHYGTTVAHDELSSNTSLGLNGSYRGEKLTTSAILTAGNGLRSLSLSPSGTIIAYENGIIMSPYQSDNFAIVEAPGAIGARAGRYNGTTIDANGHAAIPYQTPYEINEIFLDPKYMTSDVELLYSSQQITPYEGAITLSQYKTIRGYPAFFKLKGSVPFGSDVTDLDGNSIGIVGQGNTLYARLHSLSGELLVKWGDSTSEQCRLYYDLKDKNKKTDSIYHISEICH